MGRYACNVLGLVRGSEKSNFLKEGVIEDMNILLPSIALQVTYQCNIECKHCGPCCGPNEKDWMTLNEMKYLVRQATEMGAANVIFTGGEPTLLGDDLIEILRFCHQETGVKSTRMVSNGKWATSYKNAHNLLKKWQDAGLVEINISCGEFHQQYVPMQNVVNAYHAACDLNYPTVLLGGEFLKEGAGQYTIQDFQQATGADLFVPESRSPYVSKNHGILRGSAMRYGRGAQYIRPDDVNTTEGDAFAGNCSQVFAALTALPTGHITACCGVMTRDESFLTVGNWREQPLLSIWKAAQEDLIMNWIKYLGLGDMKAWLLEKDPELSLRTRFTSACDLCAEMIYNPRCQELLLNNGKERTGDILVNRLAIEAAGLQRQAMNGSTREQELAITCD